MSDLEVQIEKLWVRRTEVDPSDGEARRLVQSAIDL